MLTLRFEEDRPHGRAGDVEYCVRKGRGRELETQSM